MSKQLVAVIGILQIVLGLVLAYQAGFAAGGVFALRTNDLYTYSAFAGDGTEVGTATVTIQDLTLGTSNSGVGYAPLTVNAGDSVEFSAVCPDGYGFVYWEGTVGYLYTNPVTVTAPSGGLYEDVFYGIGSSPTPTPSQPNPTPSPSPTPTSPPAYTAFGGDGTEVGTATVTVQDLTRGTSATGLYGVSLPIGLGDSVKFSATVPSGYGFDYWSGTGYYTTNPVTIVASGSISEDVFYGIVVNPTPTPSPSPSGQTPYNPYQTPTPYQNNPTPTPTEVSSIELSTYVLFAIGVTLVCSGLLTTGFAFKKP